MTFPVKFKVSKEFLEELKRCEYGRFEDAEYMRQTDPVQAKVIYPCVFNDFSNRFKSQIEVRNLQELKELRFALATGVIEEYKPVAAMNLLKVVENTLKKVVDDLSK